MDEVWVVTLAEYRWDRGDPVRAFPSDDDACRWIGSDEARALIPETWPWAGFDVYRVAIGAQDTPADGEGRAGVGEG